MVEKFSAAALTAVVSGFLLLGASQPQGQVMPTALVTDGQPSALSQSLVQTAHVCFKTGEQAAGTNRICLYQCPGSNAAITVPMSSLCPLTINQ